MSRECDRIARKVIGSRSSSVFNPPCRDVVETAVVRGNGYELKDDIYDKMNKKNQKITGKGVMRQGLNIAPGIAEVNDLILEEKDDCEVTILEGHPEGCFRAFADESLEFSKRTAPGFPERLRLLESFDDYPENTWKRLAIELGDRGMTSGFDDLVEALALAMAARSEELQSIPRNPPSDANGLLMQMKYRRENPFDLRMYN